MKNQLPSSLLTLLKKEDIEAYTEYFYSPATRAIRELLIEGLWAKAKVVLANSDAKNKYDLSSWSELQADSIGYRRAINDFIRLLEKREIK